ncbi:LacI family DNA-binding transcriptional regulator [Haliovirga abyssi]|uniref:LacI family transcriptional regulator n=1 Tax=Haliovirga abyssi TaxID=2996794 RepID=A0AAU9E4Q9_9FUSO|nr:LacI family DNA-binding transcriptional regulator [Haliovirga abyssi]BDU51510.1 LacI family transcriptional regulator [Haliovirga abyssi]
MITIKDIAKVAGVSHSTVSRSLNDSNQISEKTKNKIKKIAEEMGFEFNLNARSLNTQKTNTLGIIVPEFFGDIRIEVFFGKMLGYLLREIEKEGYTSRIEYAKNSLDKKSNIQKMIQSRRIDGLIIIHENILEDEFEFLSEKDFPVIFLHHKPELFFDKNINYIGTDNYKGGYMATEYLINKGHEKIATLTWDCLGIEQAERTNGYIAALNSNGIKVNEKIIFKTDLSFEENYNIIEKNIDIFKEVTAVFAQTDLSALAVIEALKNNGISVPKDVSVIGYDDIEFGKFFKPYLTTIHQPIEEIVKESVKTLIDIIMTKKNKSIKKVFEPYLVERDTVIEI